MTADDTTYKWYIASVAIGQERSAWESLQQVIAKQGEKYGIRQALVPTKTVMKIRKGKKTEDEKKLFPGYVFIEMQMNSHNCNYIRSLPKIIGFLGPDKNTPEAVSDEKIKRLLETNETQKPEVNDAGLFEVGEVVNIINGPFESFAGTIEEIDHEKAKLRLSISIFGRATQVELDVSQVKKNDE